MNPFARTMPTNMKYSIVVPVYNEEENVRQLHSDIVAAMNAIGESFEVIFIDDGSSDGTVASLHALSPIVVVELRKNFGQTAAMDAGIKTAQGEWIITLDGDGQNPPSEIPKLLEKQREGGYDVVSGWRKNRRDPFLKRFVSRGANLLRSVFVKDQIHDSGCSLKLYRRSCFDTVDLHGEMHRFIPAILDWSGYRIGEVVVSHKAREHGVSKYTWRRTIKGFIDMISVWFWRKYANRPLHLFGALAFFLVGLSVLLALYLFIVRIGFGMGIADSSLPLLAVLLMILGVQFFISGILADIAIRQYYSGERKFYSIRSVERK